MASDEALVKIGKGSLVIGIGLGFGVVFEYLLKFVMARILRPESYGVVVQGIAVSQVGVVFALLGLHIGIPRLISYYSGQDEGDRSFKTISTAFYLVGFTTAIFSAATFLLSDIISATIFSEPALAGPMKVFSLTIVPLGFLFLFIAYFRGVENARYKIYVEDIVLSGSVLAFVSILLLAGLGVMGASYGYLAGAATAAFTAYMLYRRGTPDTGSSFSRKEARKMLVFSWPLFLISIFLIANKRVDVLLIGWFLESSDVGIYNVAYNIAGILSFMLGSLSYMFMPVVSGLYGEGKIDAVLDVYRTSTRWVTMAVLPIFAGLVIFPGAVIELLFGTSYVAGATSMVILAIAFFYRAFKGPAGMILLSFGRPKIQMVGTGIPTLLIFSLNLLAIPYFGIEGAAITTLFGFFIGDTFLLYMAYRELGSHPYTANYLRIFAAIAVPGAMGYLVKIFIEPSVILSAFIGVLISLVYVGLLFLFGAVEEKDMEILRDVVEPYLKYPSSLRR